MKRQYKPEVLEKMKKDTKLKGLLRSSNFMKHVVGVMATMYLMEKFEVFGFDDGPIILLDVVCMSISYIASLYLLKDHLDENYPNR